MHGVSREVTTPYRRIPQTFPVGLTPTQFLNSPCNLRHLARGNLRLMVLENLFIANEIRWRPAYKQLLYRDDAGRLIVTISQNSVDNAITELLGIVIKRMAEDEAYARAEPGLAAQVIELRNRLVLAGLAEPINTPSLPHGQLLQETGQ
ncbi:MAG: hypothetical protein RBT36_06145 [Desulfobulbus sp.]|jgi:hypothetical protein|nr:hypothetical protein [Desulfobulbus sp.]